MKKFSEFRLNERCWPGYKSVPGKKAYSPGSCVKEGWSQKYKNSIDCNNPKGFSQKAHCAGKKKNESIAEDLRQWFDPKHPKGGWKRINSKGEAIGPCAREPGEAKPKCMSNEKRAKLSKKERASAVASKRKHDPNPERQGKPINVSNFGKGKISEDMEKLDEKNVPTSPDKWARAKAMAKSKFDVYPSAYANGWAAKKYKEMGGGWKSVSEAVKELGDDPINDGTPEELRKRGSKTVITTNQMKEAIKDKFDIGEYDQEGDMAKSDLRSIMANAKRLHDMIEDADNLPEWCQNKITLAEDYISTVANYLTAEMNEEWSKTGKEATHNKTGEKTYEYAKVDKEGRKTGEREYRNAQGKPMGEEFAGWIAHYNGQKHEIKSHQAKDLYDAKKKAIEHFKIPKSKHGLLSVKPGVNEEVEQIDELSKGTLSSYAKKAAHDARIKQVVSRDFKAKSDQARMPRKKETWKSLSDKYQSQAWKREKGHDKAVDKLAKEETQLDEITQKLAGNYLSKVTQQNIQKHGMQPNMYDKLSKNRQQGVSNAFKRLEVDKAGKPVHHLVTKEETVEESRGHKVLSTFFKNREVAQRAFNKPQEKKPETKETNGHNKQPVHEQLYKKGRFVSGAGKKPFKAPSIVKSSINESRKADIVKEIVKKKKSDKFESEPELSNTQSKSDQTV